MSFLGQHHLRLPTGARGGRLRSQCRSVKLLRSQRNSFENLTKMLKNAKLTGIRDQGSGSGIRDQGSGIRDQGSGIRDQGSGIRDQGSGIRDQGSGIRDQGSGIRDQGSGIRDQGSGIRDQGSGIRDQGSGIRDQGSGIRDQGSGIRDQGSGIRDQGSASIKSIYLKRFSTSSDFDQMCKHLFQRISVQFKPPVRFSLFEKC